MKYLVLDFEFSVPRSYGKPRAWFSEIIEVGAVVADENGSICSKPYSAFVKPKFWPRLSDECYGITGIRQQDVDNGISLEQALTKLKEMAIGDETWVVAWGDADRQILGNVCSKYGLEYPFIWENYIDLALEYRVFRKLERTASLKTAVEEMGVDQFGILHSAMDDAINAALVMEKMIAAGWSMNMEQVALGPLPLGKPKNLAL